MTKTKTLSTSPAAVRARDARARKALKAAYADPSIVASCKAEDLAAEAGEPTAELPEGNPGAFAMMASTLSVEQAESAEAQAIAAIAASRASSKKAAPAVKATDARRYVLGAYRGRAGAMFDFMERCGTLGEGFTREDAVTSCLARAPHSAVSTRAQVLDYFAWAARKGLLSEYAGPVVAPVVAKAPKKSKKGAKAKA